MLGIPVTGGSRYQRWLADQWRVPAAEYQLRSGGLFGEDDPAFLGGTEPQTFQQYLAGRPKDQPYSRMGGEYLNAIYGMDPLEQQALMGVMGQKDPSGLPDWVKQQAFLGGLQEQFPGFIARGKAQQAFSPSMQRAFSISPEQIAGGTFLDYLRSRFNIR